MIGFYMKCNVRLKYIKYFSLGCWENIWPLTRNTSDSKDAWICSSTNGKKCPLWNSSIEWSNVLVSTRYTQHSVLTCWKIYDKSVMNTSFNSLKMLGRLSSRLHTCFLICYYTVPRPTLGQCLGDKVTNVILITWFLIPIFDSTVTWYHATRLDP